jgi:methylated-DNA-[protein]-cysteine S-methyltransferase
MPAHTPMFFYTYADSPIGPLLIAGDGARLHRIVFPTERRARQSVDEWRRDDGVFAAAVDQLRAYFAGALTRFDLPLRLAGTPFQNAVWSALRDIPYGETVSYQTLASRIGRPTACRAVGAANGANPLPIVVPCHRVIGANGSMTGYGGGLARKQWLLEFERPTQQPVLI